jgi:hypothetical protein
MLLYDRQASSPLETVEAQDHVADVARPSASDGRCRAVHDVVGSVTSASS